MADSSDKINAFLFGFAFFRSRMLVYEKPFDGMDCNGKHDVIVNVTMKHKKCARLFHVIMMYCDVIGEHASPLFQANGSLLCVYLLFYLFAYLQDSLEEIIDNRPLLLGGHVESLETKKICFCTVSLALNSRLAEACRAKTKLFIPSRLDMAA